MSKTTGEDLDDAAQSLDSQAPAQPPSAQSETHSETLPEPLDESTSEQPADGGHSSEDPQDTARPDPLQEWADKHSDAESQADPVDDSDKPTDPAEKAGNAEKAKPNDATKKPTEASQKLVSDKPEPRLDDADFKGMSQRGKHAWSRVRTERREALAEVSKLRDEFAPLKATADKLAPFKGAPAEFIDDLLAVGEAIGKGQLDVIPRLEATIKELRRQNGQSEPVSAPVLNDAQRQFLQDTDLLREFEELGTAKSSPSPAATVAPPAAPVRPPAVPGSAPAVSNPVPPEVLMAHSAVEAFCDARGINLSDPGTSAEMRAELDKLAANIGGRERIPAQKRLAYAKVAIAAIEARRAAKRVPVSRPSQALRTTSRVPVAPGGGTNRPDPLKAWADKH